MIKESRTTKQIKMQMLKKLTEAKGSMSVAAVRDKLSRKLKEEIKNMTFRKCKNVSSEPRARLMYILMEATRTAEELILVLLELESGGLKGTPM